MHVNQQIRNAVSDRLAERVAAIAGQVLRRRDDAAFANAIFPIAAVSTVTSNVNTQASSSGGPGQQTRSVDVDITIIDDIVHDSDNGLEDLAVDVEAAFGDWSSLPIKLISFELVSTALIDVGESETGTLTGFQLRFRASVGTREGKADTSLMKG